MEVTSGANQFRVAARPAAAPAQTDAPDSDRMELKGSTCPSLQGCQKLRGANPTDKFTVSVILTPPKAMVAPADGVYPATQGQIDTISKFAKANGLSIADVDPKTRTVKLEGTAANYQKAFGVELSQYKDASGKPFRAYEGNLSMPRAAGSQVAAVLGLSNRPIAQPRNTGFRPRQNDVPSNGYTPMQVASAYNFPKNLDGSGQTISIIELGGGYNQSEMEQYFKKMGVKAPNIQAIGVDGANNVPGGDPWGADGEVALDIEVAGAVAPGANIKVYFAPNSDQGFVDAVNQAAKDNAKNPGPISISWGAGENNWSSDAVNAFDGALKDAAHQGFNVFVASGDNGSTDGADDGKNHADFPSASPWAIGTGGTLLSTDAKGKKTSEVAWSQDGASGGGVSVNFPKPDYQQGVNVPAPDGKQGGRGVPDVAGDAAPESGYDVLFDGQEGAIGGTSAVAPLYAGLTALLQQGVGGSPGFLNPIFYQHPDAFNDITSGNNGGYQAGKGWDAVTGLGSPDGQKLLAVLQQKAPVPTQG